MRSEAVDYVVIGGGFYGCCLALMLRSISEKVMLVEAGNQLMERASRVNQARVHTGFHYPRSALTAVKSMVLRQRFAADFPDAVVSNFQMLYAIAARRSKVSAKRFYRSFVDMGAPIAPATPSQAALFRPDFVEGVFACEEFAFDFSVLRQHFIRRFAELDFDVRLNSEVCELEDCRDEVVVRLSDGSEVRARRAFNVTYSQINHLLRSGLLPEADLKHELAEVALVKVPSSLEGIGITVMDGPFFSCMPYPSAGRHSLTHVRYTPHASWTDQGTDRSAYEVRDSITPESQCRHMVLDASRFVPAIADVEWDRSLFDVKTLLIKNEKDDGRPILFRQQPETSRVISIMGGKIDNIYDLFDLVRQTEPEWKRADERYVFPG